jgi:hypothetical protein
MSPEKPPRLSEGERETAVERLQQAFAEGHLSPEEMDERLHVALTATTPGELTPALTALPDKDAERRAAYTHQRSDGVRAADD